MKVAVYGSLKAGFHNHVLLEGYAYLGTCKLRLWDMYSLGAYPAIVRGRGSIHCEVYEVDEAGIHSLDRLEGYNETNPEHSYYNRTEVVTCYGDALIYYMNEAPGGAQVKDGRWRRGL